MNILPEGSRPILLAGHGGMIGGKYQTAGKRSPKWQFGTYFEGAGNRWLINLIIRELDTAGVPYYVAAPEYEDVSLGERTRRVNRLYARDPRTYLFEQHSNAGRGTGIEGFTSPGQTLSDSLATFVLSRLEAEFLPQGFNMRYDLATDRIGKEAKFYNLIHTHCPAFLMEWLFMDHPVDYRRLFSQSVQQAYACNVAGSMIDIYRGGMSLAA